MSYRSNPVSKAEEEEEVQKANSQLLRLSDILATAPVEEALVRPWGERERQIRRESEAKVWV